tara:strand:+ start:443 stop:592 length:150 start_codon:yes stop_codon:yes gene_type:complete
MHPVNPLRHIKEEGAGQVGSGGLCQTAWGEPLETVLTGKLSLVNAFIMQ